MRNNFIRLISFILASVLIFTSVPINTFATEYDGNSEIEIQEIANDENGFSSLATEVEETQEEIEDDIQQISPDNNEFVYGESEDVSVETNNEILNEIPDDEDMVVQTISENNIYFDLDTFNDRYSDEWDKIRNELWWDETHNSNFYVNRDVYDYIRRNDWEYNNQMARGWEYDYILDFYEEREGAEGWSGDYMYYHTSLLTKALLYNWDSARVAYETKHEFVEYDGELYYPMYAYLNTDNYPGFDIRKEPEIEEIVSNLVGPGGALDVSKYSNDADKIKAAYNWVVNNVKYVSGYDSDEDSLYYFAYAGFTEGKGSCECMAQCLYYILRKMNVGVRILFNNKGHVYNMARVGYEWYYVDCSAKKCLKGRSTMGNFKPNEYILPSYCFDYYIFEENYINMVPSGDYAFGTKLYSDVTTLSIRTGEQSEKLHAYTGYPYDSSTEVTNLTWKSADTKIATVSGGVVTGVGPGRVKITATSGTKSITYLVSVIAPVSEVSVTPYKIEEKEINGRRAITLFLDETGKAKFMYKPLNATLYDYMHADVSDTSVIDAEEIVDEESGDNYIVRIVKPKNYGYSKLIIKTALEDGTELSDELDVYVCRKVTLNANGGLFGSNESIDIHGVCGEVVSKQVEYCVPKNAGKRFAGWYTDAEGGEPVDISTLVVTDDITLYARWDYAYTAGKPMFVNAKGEEISGEVPYGTKVYLKSNTYGSEIRYTMATGDVVPEEPTLESDVYDDAFVITEKTTFKAVTYKDGYAPGVLDAPVVFTIKDESADWGELADSDTEALIAEGKNADDIPKGLWATDIEEMTYAGKNLTPDVRVYFGKKLLKKGTDYTLKYSNNKNKGTAKVTITGKNNYTGTIIKTFEIMPISLSEAMVPNVYVTKNGQCQKAVSKITCEVGGKTVTLKKNRDFTLYFPGTDKSIPEAYNANAFVEEGIYTAYAEGTGNFSGYSTYFVHVVDKKVIDKLKIVNEQVMYDGGKAVAPSIKVFDGTKELVLGVDYELEYYTNTAVGTYPVTITCIGNYAGVKRINYKIAGADISKYAVSYSLPDDKSYSGAEKELSDIKVYKKGDAKKGIEDGIPLVEDIDYELEYKNNINAAGNNKATLYIKGKNGYVGQKKVTFTISPRTLKSDDIQVSVVSANYVKGGAKPAVTIMRGDTELILNKDYTLKYASNTIISNGETGKKIPTVTVKGKGNYKDSVSKHFAIVKKDLDLVKITAGDVIYKNKAGICKPSITLKDTDGKKLVSNTDYKKNIVYTYEEDVIVTQIISKKPLKYVKYVRSGASEDGPGDVVNSKDIIPAGTLIRATVTGSNKYYGTKSVLFRFVKASVASAKASVKTQIFTGKEIYPTKSDITINIPSNEYRIIKYSNNVNKGNKASLTIEGIGNYGGTKTINFSIKAKTMNYTVVFDSNVPEGLTVTGKAMAKQVMGAGAKLPKNTYAIRGYSFVGWLPDRYDAYDMPLADKGMLNLNPKKYSSGDKVTLKAIWMRDEYDITYMNMGEDDVNPNPISYNVESDTITLADPVREGWIFKGWYLDSGFTKSITSIPAKSVGDIKIYAKWEGYYTITYVLNGGTNHPDNLKHLTYKPGETFILEVPRKPGMLFDGWYTTPDFQEDSWTSWVYTYTTGDLTLYAKWVTD